MTFRKEAGLQSFNKEKLPAVRRTQPIAISSNFFSCYPSQCPLDKIITWYTTTTTAGYNRNLLFGFSPQNAPHYNSKENGYLEEKNSLFVTYIT